MPWSSPTASSCFVADEWNSIEVTAADVIATLIDGSCDRSSRSQTSIEPSALPTNTTAGRVGDHAPHVSRHEANGAEKSGEETPSFHRWKHQSPTDRCTSGMCGERRSAVHGPWCAVVTERTPRVESAPGLARSMSTISPSSVTAKRRHGSSAFSGT